MDYYCGSGHTKLDQYRPRSPFTDSVGQRAKVRSAGTRYRREVQLSVEGSNNVQWSPADGLSCVDCNEPIAAPRQTTTYTVSTESCFGTTVQTQITVVVQNPPSLTLTNSGNVLQGEEILMTAVSSDPDALITWYANGEVVCEDCSELIAQPTISLVYLVTVENEFGCVNSDEIYIEVEDGCSYSNFEVPNIISPNGDGSNDYFKIKYEGISDISLLRIYNRWGELIFETKNVETLWDGTFRGEKLNPGVYVYYFEGHCLDDKLFTKTGNITILK
jgi:gliding motility-associated-like protein